MLQQISSSSRQVHCPSSYYRHIRRATPRSARCLRVTANHGAGATSNMRRGLDVIVIGAGIGGLTAASALLEAGARVRVFESRSKSAALTGPGGIFIQANAEKVLRLLQSPWPAPPAGADPATSRGRRPPTSTLSDAIYEVGGPILSGGFRDDLGNYLYYADVDSTGLQDLKSNGLVISRGALQSVLYAAIPREAVHFGEVFRSFTAPANGETGKVQVAFESGRVEECDVLVGADGIRSKVRTQLLGGKADLKYSGSVCWRGNLPLSRIPGGAESFLKAVNNDSWSEYWGKGIRIGFITSGRQAVLDPAVPGGVRVEGEPMISWYAFANLPEDWKPEPGADEAARMRQLFKDFGHPVPQLCAAMESSTIHISKILYQEPRPAPWGVGRVTLLGDAAHAMAPTLGQGGCMAIEDGLELANELGLAAPAQPTATATTSHDRDAVQRLEEALRRYEASRAPRTKRVADQSLQVAELAMAESDVTVWLRNMIYRLTPKWAGDKQFEYLFKDYVPAWVGGVRVGREFGPPQAPSSAAGEGSRAAAGQ